MENKRGDLRVWCFRNRPENITHYPVRNLKEAIKKINQLADRDLRPNSKVVMNGFGLEIYDEDGLAGYYNDGWEEYYNEEGFDIGQIMEKEK